MEKKFKIGKVVTDREQQKENKEKEKEIKQEMRSDEWLADKITADCAELLSNGLKRYKFVQDIRDKNTDIAHPRMTRQIQRMFEEEWLMANDKGIIVAGKNFPKDKLVSSTIVEQKDLYGRVKKIKND